MCLCTQVFVHIPLRLTFAHHVVSRTQAVYHSDLIVLVLRLTKCRLGTVRSMLIAMFSVVTLTAYYTKLSRATLHQNILNYFETFLALMPLHNGSLQQFAADFRVDAGYNDSLCSYKLLV